MTAKEEKLKQILLELEKNSEVTNSAIISHKGQLMTSALHNDMDERAIAAMSAALQSVGMRVGSTLKTGRVQSIVINGDAQLVILEELNQALLVAIAPADAKIGLIDFEVSNALDKIKMVLG
ncbi:MAG: roadblock/LC7 domain-containing protein [Promethearchaeota archaeon]